MRTKKQIRRNRIIALVIISIMIVAIFGAGVLIGFHLGHKPHSKIELIETVEAKEAEFITAEVVVPEPEVETEPKLPVIQTAGRTLSPELAETMAKMSEKYNIPLALTVAMAEQESRFNPDAVSSTNDYGIMQINQINHGWLRQSGIEPMNHKGNIEAGCLMISNAISKYSDYNKALMAYNCGDAGANKLWKQGIYSSVYSRAVMEKYAKWDEYLKGA